MNALRIAQRFWQHRTPRERLALLSLAVLLGGALLWSWSLRPAWQAWQASAARQAQAARTSQALAQWQAQAQALQALPPQATLKGTEWVQWLNTQTPRWLGPEARVQAHAQGFEVQWRQASAEGLAQWLHEVRTQAHAVPQQAQLEAVTVPGAATPMWRGQILLVLP